MKILDVDIRQKVHENVVLQFDSSTRIVDEMSICLGVSRVDIAAINGKLHGYEIKSEADNLMRLRSQIENYNRVFDTMTIVCSDKHIDKVKELIPDWWGILAVKKNREGFRLVKKRKTRDNHDIDKLALAQLLWRDEAIDLLKNLGLQKGYLSKPRYIVWERIASDVSVDILKDYVRDTLKSRENWRVD